MYDFSYNDTKLVYFDEMGNFFTQKVLFRWLLGGILTTFLGKVCNVGLWRARGGFPNVQVITEFDILTVSDGTNLVIAHTGGTYNLIAGEAELLAGLLYEADR